MLNAVDSRLAIRALAVVSLVCMAATSVFPQSVKPNDPGASPPKEADPYGRETPRRSALGFLRAAQNGNYPVAAMYLQLSDSERRRQGEVLARQLRDLLDRAFVGHLPLLSDQPEGSLADGLAPNMEFAGTIIVGEKNIDFLLVHMPAASSPSVWLVAPETLREVPGLHAKLDQAASGKGIPDFLVHTIILGVNLSQWLLLLVFVPLSWGAAKLIVWIVSAVSRRAHSYWARVESAGDGKLSRPFTFALTIVIHHILTNWLELPLLSRYYYSRVSWILLACAGAWLISRLVQRTAAMASYRFNAGKWAAGSAAVLLGRRVFDAILIILVVLLSLNILGFDTRTALAGLGIGGLALALGMQKTLENFLGGVTLLSDSMLRIGDEYKLGERIGTVEDVRLRSTTFRMSEGTALTIPNGILALKEIETLSGRSRTLMQCVIQLSRETTVAQLRTVLAEIRRILGAQERVEPQDARVRLIGFGASSLDLELFAYVHTSRTPEFLAIREDILFQIMNAIESSGTRLAFPAQTLYIADKEMAAPGLPQRRVLPESVRA
jgi:MscS family membrane protein